MKDAGRPRRHWNELAIFAVLLAILALTLIPSGKGPPSPFSITFTPGRRGFGDAILNFLLFLPLGLALAWNGRPAVVAGLCGLLVASAVEFAQIVLPGRDPALSDIILNTAGALAGAVIARRRRGWMSPGATVSAVLTASSLLIAAVLMIASAVLLSPLGDEPVFIARSGNDLLLRYPSRGGAFGFDQPEYWLPGAFALSVSEEPSSVSLFRNRARWQITIGSVRATLGPTVGKGWALLAYPDAIGRRWSPVLNAGWMLVVCMPVGFWALGKLRLIAAVITILLVAFIPEITGAVATTPMEWVGAVMGFLVGALLGESSRRRLSHSRA